MTTTQEEFMNWYEAHHGAFSRYCSSRALGWMATEDLMQEAILATLKRFDELVDSGRRLAYLIGTVNNIVAKEYRRTKFRAPWDERLLDQLESRLHNPEAALDVQILLKTIENLPDEQGEALRLFELSGFSVKEIAAIQDCQPGAVKTRLHRARNRVRTLLEEAPQPRSFSNALATCLSILF